MKRRIALLATAASMLVVLTVSFGFIALSWCSISLGFNIQCTTESNKYLSVEGEIRSCITHELNVTTRNEAITSVNCDIPGYNLGGLIIENQVIYYLPTNIEEYFPNTHIPHEPDEYFSLISNAKAKEELAWAPQFTAESLLN